MPNLKIDSCQECPFSKITSESWMTSEYNIQCIHEDQEDKEYKFTHKMRFGNGIYFTCPLKDKESESS